MQGSLVTSFFLFQCEEGGNSVAQKPKASCEENNVAMLSAINLMFLLKDSSTILVERVSQ